MSQVSEVMVRKTQAGAAELSDAHCHLELFRDPALAIKNARAGGVGLIISSGGTLEGNVGAVEMAKNEIVFATIGIDPSAIDKAGSVKNIAVQVKTNSKIIGIGEAGLDSKYLAKYGIRLQKAVFEEQIEVAKSLSIPVVVHSRGMIKHIIEIMSAYQDVRFMIHFFEGTVEDAERIVSMGNLVSIPTMLTSNRKKVIKHLGIDNIVVETDSPVAGRSPSDVKGTVELISKMKGISFYDVASMITGNLRRFFYI